MPGPSLLCALLAALCSALPCRFTVRDVAYCDLGDEGYRLRACVSERSAPGLTEAAREAGASLFADSNVRLEVVDPEGSEASMRWAEELELPPFPCLVLSGPRLRPLALPCSGGLHGPEGMESLLRSAADSPLRREMRESLPELFCALILVEGTDEARNRAATQAAEAALDRLAAVYDRMPKEVGEPPRLLRLAVEDRDAERVLVWSLGLEADAGERPALAAIMGRGRCAGEVLVGDAISPGSVFGILSLVGADCECDLDRSWMRGARLPMRWDAAASRRATRELGFDPQSPGVLAEISGILARGPGASPANPSGDMLLEELLLSYSEESEEPGPPAGDGETAEAIAAETGVEPPVERGSEEAATLPSEEPSPVRSSLWTLAALGAVILFGGFLILIRARCT